MTTNIWDYLCSDNIKKNIDEKTKEKRILTIPIYEGTLVINKSKKSIKELISLDIKFQKDINKFVKILADDTYEIMSFHNTTELLEIVSPNKLNQKEWEKVDKMLTKHNLSIKQNNKLFNNILKVKKNGKLNKEENIFINIIYDSIIKDGLFAKNKERTEVLKYHREKLENIIIQKLVEPTNIIINKNDIDSESYSLNITEISDAEIEISNNRNIFPYLARVIKTNNSRKILDNMYFLTSKSVLKDFVKLVLCRNEFAKCIGNTNYANMIDSSDNLEQIQLFLHDMIGKLTDKYYNVVEQLYIDNNIKNKLQYTDIIHYISKLRESEFDIKFTVNDVLLLIFEFLNNYFGFKFVSVTNQPVWDEGVGVFEVYNEKNDIYGYIYIDLLFRNNKVVSPMVVINNSSHEFPYNSKNKKLPSVTLIAGYNSLKTKLLTISDCIFLFKQFGKIISHLCDKSKLGLGIYNKHQHLFIEKICELIATSPEFLSKLTDNKNIIDEVIRSKEAENICDMFNTCIDSLFDILINTSDVFIGMCKNLIKEKKDIDSNIEKVYHEIYDRYMKPLCKYIEYDNKTIHPNLIYNITNNNDILLYHKVYNQIIATNILSLLKNTQCGIRCRNEVFESTDIDFLKNIKLFMENEKKTEDKYSNNININKDTNFKKKIENVINSNIKQKTQLNNNIVESEINKYEE
jgi:hypothetical protein